MSSIVVVGIGPEGSGSHAADVAAGYATALGAAMILVFGYEPSSLGPRGGPFEDQIEEIADEVTKDVRSALAAAHPDLAITVELVRDLVAKVVFHMLFATEIERRLRRRTGDDVPGGPAAAEPVDRGEGTRHMVWLGKAG